MAYMTISEFRRQARGGMAGLAGGDRVKWSGGSAGQYNEQGILYGTSTSEAEKFLADQAAKGFVWDGTAWVQQAPAIPPSTILSAQPQPAPATIYIDPATGQTVAAPAPAYYPPPQTYYQPAQPTPMYAPTYAPPPPAAPPQTIVPTEMVGQSITSVPAVGGMVPTWAWIAGAAAIAAGLFIVARK